MSALYKVDRRRSRLNTHIRELTASISLSHTQFIQPLFIDELLVERKPLPTLDGVNSETLDSALNQIEDDLKYGISKFLIFPIPALKSERNFDYSFAVNNIRSIKARFGNNIWLAADVCLCAFTTHGHCGILNANGDSIANQETVSQLADYALQLANAGVDCIAPSDMMDGRVAAIRKVLDDNGHESVSILSYSAKFSSSFYGPFRDACKSSPTACIELRDRKSYQLSPFNINDAILTTVRDVKEGSDIVLVKPAGLYLDIITRIKQEIKYTPIAAYHVSGEYQALELLAMNSGTPRSLLHLETWISLKRAGADIIISYAARHAQQWLQDVPL